MIDPNKTVSYFVAEMEYNVVIPVYEGSDYDSNNETEETDDESEEGGS